MTDNKSNLFYVDPPNKDDFHAIFLYFWNLGLGRPIINGVQSPWNKYDLEGEFITRGKNIDVRTIENWRSGKNVPHVRNLLILSNIAAAGDKYRQTKWSEAFLKNYNKKRIIIDKPAIVSSSYQSDSSRRKTNFKKARSSYHYAMAGLFTIIGLLTVLVIKGTDWDAGSTSKTVRIANFQNQTNNSDLDQLSKGLSALVLDSIYQIDEISVVKSIPNNSPKYKVDALLECVILGAKDKYSIVCTIFDEDEQTVIWSRKLEFSELDELKGLLEAVPAALAEITGVALSESAKTRMKLLGTSDLEAFIAFKKGRSALKDWHQSRTEDGMQIAYEQLLHASKLDPNWSEPKFQIVDIYHHFISGDTSILHGFGKDAAAREVPNLLNAASSQSINDEEKYKAKMNAIFFSDNWQGLKDSSTKFVEVAVQRRGELEWLYEPIILLVLGDQNLFQELQEKRMKRFDPENGTVHAYKFRNYLLNDQSEEVLVELRQAKVSKFQNRIDEVLGFVLFHQNRGQDLLDHSKAKNNLSPMYRDYFRAISFSMIGNQKAGIDILNSSVALADAEEYLAFAYLHLGDRNKAKELLDKVAEAPLGHINISTAIAYGAACGSQNPPLPISIMEKYLQANIELPKCVVME